jgi:hypothetical protein
MAPKQTTSKETGEILDHIVSHMGTKDEIAGVKGEIRDPKAEMLDEFEDVDTRFSANHDQLRDISSEIAVIHRRVERLAELGASNAGFAREIDHALERIAAIEKHLGLDKKIAA